MASDVKITFRARHRWLFLAMFFDRLGRFCDQRALVATDGHGKDVRGRVKFPADGGRDHTVFFAFPSRAEDDTPRAHRTIFRTQYPSGARIIIEHNGPLNDEIGERTLERIKRWALETLPGSPAGTDDERRPH